MVFVGGGWVVGGVGGSGHVDCGSRWAAWGGVLFVCDGDLVEGFGAFAVDGDDGSVFVVEGYVPVVVLVGGVCDLGNGGSEGVVDVSVWGLGGEVVEAYLGAACFDGGVVAAGGVCAGGEVGALVDAVDSFAGEVVGEGLGGGGDGGVEVGGHGCFPWVCAVARLALAVGSSVGWVCGWWQACFG